MAERDHYETTHVPDDDAVVHRRRELDDEPRRIKQKFFADRCTCGGQYLGGMCDRCGNTELRSEALDGGDA